MKLERVTVTLTPDEVREAILRFAITKFGAAQGSYIGTFDLAATLNKETATAEITEAIVWFEPHLEGRGDGKEAPR